MANNDFDKEQYKKNNKEVEKDENIQRRIYNFNYKYGDEVVLSEADSNIKYYLSEINTKEDFENFVKLNFSAILSYGEDEKLIPAGVFDITEINYEKKEVILTQKDNKDVKIIMPLKALKKFILIGDRNSNKPDFYGVDVISAEKVSDKASEIVEEELDLLEAEMMSFEEDEITLIRDGESAGRNYSLCPVETVFNLILQRDLEYIPDKGNEKPIRRKILIENGRVIVKEENEIENVGGPDRKPEILPELEY